MTHRNVTKNQALSLIGFIASPWLYLIGESLAIKTKRKIIEQRLKNHKKSVRELSEEFMVDITDIMYSTEDAPMNDVERVWMNYAFLNIIKEL